MGFKNWWNSKSYFFRSGLLFSTVFFILPYIISLILFRLYSRDQLQIIYSSGLTGSILTILTFPQLIGNLFLGSIGNIVIFAIYFLIGAFGGWIVEKLMKKKVTPPLNKNMLK